MKYQIKGGKYSEKVSGTLKRVSLVTHSTVHSTDWSPGYLGPMKRPQCSGTNNFWQSLKTSGVRCFQSNKLQTLIFCDKLWASHHRISSALLESWWCLRNGGGEPFKSFHSGNDLRLLSPDLSFDAETRLILFKMRKQKVQVAHSSREAEFKLEWEFGPGALVLMIPMDHNYSIVWPFFGDN